MATTKSPSNYHLIESVKKFRWWEWVGMVVLIGLPFAGGFAGARMFNNGSYKRGEFSKPPWAAPAVSFSIGWSISYASMGIASFLIWVRGRNTKWESLVSGFIMYIAQLVLAWVWTPLFFGHNKFCAGHCVRLQKLTNIVMPSTIIANGSSTDNITVNPKDVQTYDYGKEWQFVEKIQGLINQQLSMMQQKETPVLNYRDPEKLKALVHIGLSKCAADQTELLALCEEVVKYSVKTANPFFQNQLYGAWDPYSLAAAFLIDSLNTNVYTFDVGPVFTLIELEVIRFCLDLVGFENGDGILTPGGSMANMYSIALSRHRYNPEIKRTGLFGCPKLIIFTSEESHYSVLKGAAFTGIGTDQIVSIPCDSTGAMDHSALEREIQQVIDNPNQHPLMVWATTGTTVLGGIDPCEQIADICKKYNVWMHVDACLGGSVLLSNKYKHLLKGIERSDSVTWNWHKLQGAPLQTSVFLCRHQALLKECNGASATYLFQTIKHYDTEYDRGDASIQCSRRPESLKIWLMVKARGLAGLSQLLDIAFDRTRYTVEKLRNMNKVKLVLSKPNLTAVCFWILPGSARNKPENEEFWSMVNDAAPKIKRKMVEAGFSMLTFQGLSNKKFVNFFRITYKFHPILSYQEIDELIDGVVAFSDDL